MSKYTIVESTMRSFNGYSFELSEFSVKAVFDALNLKQRAYNYYRKDDIIIIITTHYTIKIKEEK